MNKKNKNKKKINKKKKGFTLIELLAVIVVLAIVLVVTIPSVLSSMKNAKQKQLENATASVKEWFEKQYDAAKLGEEYASQEYKDYLAAVCNTGTDEDKAECKKLLKYTKLTSDVIKAAGVDSDDFDVDSSYIAFSDSGNAEVNLVTSTDSKFSSNGNVAIANSNDYTNLFDLSKRNGIYNNTWNPEDEKNISTANYYYSVASSGYFKDNNGGTNTNISNLTVSSNGITFESNKTAYYGVYVPFILDYNFTYKLEYTKNDYGIVSILRLDSNGIYKSYAKIDSGKTFTPNKDEIIGIVFVSNSKNTEVVFSNISLTKVS